MTTRRTTLLLLALALGSEAQVRANPSALKFVAGQAADPSAAGFELAGKLFLKGDARYEPLRQAATWNARKPDRFPSAIVLAENERDVIAAVKMAKAKGWQVTARSGGHAFTGSHTRDNAVQINLARMKEISVDPHKRVAVVSPAWKSGPFNNVLRDRHQLMFPVAHGYDVGLGGFVLCGGHGWNSRVHGLACENLRALDVVTADGELIRCDENRNSDFLWAARGSGPGFFGIAVRYHLDLHPAPIQTTISELVFPLDVVADVMAWVDGTAFPECMEVIINYLVKDGVPVILVMAVTFAATKQEADQALAVLQSCPVAGSALHKRLDVPTTIPAPSEAEDVFSVATGGRFTVDGAYTEAPLTEVFSLLHRELLAPPTPFCHFAVGHWQPTGRIKDMAYSITGRHYVSVMAITYDPAEDQKCAAWVARLIELLTPIATGAQMNDENIPVNKLPYLSKASSARLESLRAKYDPERRFPSFLS